MNKAQLPVQEVLAQTDWGFLGTQGYVLGMDLGGYGLRAVLVDLHGEFYTSVHQEMQGEPAQVVETALELARNLLKENQIAAERLVRVGIGFGGPVDPDTGLVRLSPRLPGWEEYPLRDRFEQALDAVTLIDNDANLIALGEATFGIGRDTNHLFYMHLSSGVGGGLVLNGRLYHGATATAGEIGHAVVGGGWEGVAPTATLEELVSIAGLLRRAAGKGLQTDNLHDIFADETTGREVIAETTTLLATRLAQIVALLDPEMIVLGGIVTRIGGDAFVNAIGEQVNRYIAPQFARPVQVVASQLGFDSVAIGALAMALESLRD